MVKLFEDKEVVIEPNSLDRLAFGREGVAGSWFWKFPDFKAWILAFMINYNVFKVGVGTASIQAINLSPTAANGDYSMAIGGDVVVDGYSAFGFGQGNVVGSTGVSSGIGGTGNTNNGTSCFVIGSGNYNDGSYSIVGGVSNGTETTPLVAINSIIAGSSNAAGGASHCISGSVNTVNGSNNNVSGNEQTVGGTNCISSGLQNITNGSNNINTGYINEITATGSSNGIIGGQSNEIKSTSSSSSRSVILGGADNVIDDVSNSVIAGGSNITAIDDDTLYSEKQEIVGAGNGIIMASPDGTRYRLTIANGGGLTTTAI